MLVWWGGRLYYSDALVWLAAGSIAASAPLAWTAGVWPEECLGVAGLQVLDWCLSATVLHCIVGAWLRWSLLPGWAAGRPSLYVLRATSALVGSASLLWLVATLVPRAVLGVSALLSVSLSLSGACWSAALWLQLQECGLAAALPPSLRAALLHTPPLELLGRDAPLAQAVARALQLTGVLLVPEADRGAALQRPSPLEAEHRSLVFRLKSRGHAFGRLPLHSTAFSARGLTRCFDCTARCFSHGIGGTLQAATPVSGAAAAARTACGAA